MIIDHIISTRLAAPRDAFEKAFLSELLISEQFRLTFLSAFFTAAALWIFLSPDFFIIQFPFRGFYRGLPWHFWFAGFWALVALYEFVVGQVFALFKKNNRQPPTGAFYMNAIVEGSIPTLGLYLISRNIGVNALATPMPAFYFIFILLSALRLNFKLSLVMGITAAYGYLGVAIVILTEQHSLVPCAMLQNIDMHLNKALLLLMTGVAAGFVGHQIRNRVVDVMEALQERNRVEKIFGQHVSPEVVERLLGSEIEMESEQRSVCVLFLDIRDFTVFSHTHPPEAVVDYLNVLFESMITIINRHHGIINKFLGDGFMAVFGAPFSNGDDCRNAVRAALEITNWVDGEVTAGRIPPTRTGIGIHCGETVTGHVGSNFRKEYTVIGDAVNLASRLESLNKEYGTRILVSENVWEKVRTETAAIGEFGPVRVKGRSTPVRVYSLA